MIIYDKVVSPIMLRDSILIPIMWFKGYSDQTEDLVDLEQVYNFSVFNGLTDNNKTTDILMETLYLPFNKETNTLDPL